MSTLVSGSMDIGFIKHFKDQNNYSLFKIITWVPKLWNWLLHIFNFTQLKKETCSHNEHVFQGISFGERRLGAKMFVPAFKLYP